ncbi:uncharacterized protein BDR25DRAFT_348987 [Lindgomyces ingoldianus]|uniref:Uncharacterized protein n=1 Tax=Lindgomyces ingoldianus TaxID=673940 RepID=A0ACB6RD83_9PLEO|nr:uncharacterized protein BDR25DRAFT_348987 [Lindgomyces ingoldianus]KAF2477101.1 hypothetical protein BDR25DRAFT_348987 [Lindgomyces ingoldianus]
MRIEVARFRVRTSPLVDVIDLAIQTENTLILILIHISSIPLTIVSGLTKAESLRAQVYVPRELYECFGLGVSSSSTPRPLNGGPNSCYHLFFIFHMAFSTVPRRFVVIGLVNENVSTSEQVPDLKSASLPILMPSNSACLSFQVAPAFHLSPLCFPSPVPCPALRHCVCPYFYGPPSIPQHNRLFQPPESIFSPANSGTFSYPLHLTHISLSMIHPLIPLNSDFDFASSILNSCIKELIDDAILPMALGWASYMDPKADPKESDSGVVSLSLKSDHNETLPQFDTRCNPNNFTEIQRFDGNDWIHYYTCMYEESCRDLKGIGTCYQGNSIHILPVADDNNYTNIHLHIVDPPFEDAKRCSPTNQSESLSWDGQSWFVGGVCFPPYECKEFSGGSVFCVIQGLKQSDRPPVLPINTEPPPPMPADSETPSVPTKCRNETDLLRWNGTMWIIFQKCPSGSTCYEDESGQASCMAIDAIQHPPHFLSSPILRIRDDIRGAERSSDHIRRDMADDRASGNSEQIIPKPRGPQSCIQHDNYASIIEAYSGKMYLHSVCLPYGERPGCCVESSSGKWSMDAYTECGSRDPGGFCNKSWKNEKLARSLSDATQMTLARFLHGPRRLEEEVWTFIILETVVLGCLDVPHRGVCGLCAQCVFLTSISSHQIERSRFGVLHSLFTLHPFVILFETSSLSCMTTSPPTAVLSPSIPTNTIRGLTEFGTPQSTSSTGQHHPNYLKIALLMHDVSDTSLDQWRKPTVPGNMRGTLTLRNSNSLLMPSVARKFKQELISTSVKWPRIYLGKRATLNPTALQLNLDMPFSEYLLAFI